MALFGPLPPADQDAVFTITIPKEVYPYMQAFYNLKKLDGETEEQYIVRALITYGKEYYKNMAMKQITEQAMLSSVQAIEDAKALVDSI